MPRIGSLPPAAGRAGASGNAWPAEAEGVAADGDAGGAVDAHAVHERLAGVGACNDVEGAGAESLRRAHRAARVSPLRSRTLSHAPILSRMCGPCTYDRPAFRRLRLSCWLVCGAVHDRIPQ